MISKISSVDTKKINLNKHKAPKQVCLQNYAVPKTLNLNLSPSAYICRTPINFGAMKKSQFSSIDLMMVNQLKSPIEKMNTNDDFQKYCQDILDKKYLGEENLKKLSASIDPQAKLQKEAILKDWINYVVEENDAYTPAIELMILSSITKNLDENSNHLPPILDKGKIATTVEEITENCKKNSQYQCNFDKLYRTNLQKEYLKEETQLDENLSGWVVIPSKEHDPQNFEENVKKLKTLSHHNWCTKTFNAEPYLAKGDFHVYLEKGQPKLGVRFSGDEIQEIQGERNNSRIPLSYFDVVKSHVEENKYKLNDYTQDEFTKAKEGKIEVKKIKLRLAEPIKRKDYQKVLKYFGIKVEKNENGLMTISELKNPNAELDIFFHDIGIDINDLLKHVKKVNNNLNLNYDESLTSTGELEEVNENAEFRGCTNLKEIKNLKKVGRFADFSGCKQLTSTGALEKVVGNTYFYDCKNLKEFPNLIKCEAIDGLTDKQKEILKFSITEKIKVKLEELTGKKLTENELFKKEDYPKILEYFGVKVEKDKDDFMTISHLREPNFCPNIFFHDIGIDINDLLMHVKKINGNLDLMYDTSLKSTGALEEIGRGFFFRSCINLQEFPNLIKYGFTRGLSDNERQKLSRQVEINKAK